MKTAWLLSSLLAVTTISGALSARTVHGITVEVNANPDSNIRKKTKVEARQAVYGAQSGGSSALEAWQAAGEDWPVGSGRSPGESSSGASSSSQGSSSGSSPSSYMGSGSGSGSGSSSQQQSSNSYGRQSSANKLAQPIIQTSQQMNLNQLYLPANSPAFHLENGVKVPNPRQELLANLNFYKDFDAINPRNPNALWDWVGTGSGTGYLADNAAFVRRAANYKYSAHLDLISIPFKQYANSSDPVEAQLSLAEGAIQLTNNATLTLNSMQRLLVRLVFGCETINADQFPEAATVSKNPWDDPRLATCFFRLDSNNNTILAVLVTNEGVWAYYTRTPALNAAGTAVVNGAQSFTAYRRIGNRKSVKDIVDAAIQYDARTNTATWFLNGYPVWSVGMIGVAPASDGVTVVTSTNGTRTMPVTLSNFQLSLGTAKKLDDADLNNPGSTLAIVQLVNATGFYPAQLTFADPLGLPGNMTWGQGAISSLYQLKIIRADSLPSSAAASTVLAPAVYGQSSSSSSMQSSNAAYESSPSGGGSGYSADTPASGSEYEMKLTDKEVRLHSLLKKSF